MIGIPDGWERTTLSEVVGLQRGFDLPHHAREPGKYPVLTSGETGGTHSVGPVKGPGFVVGRATNLGKPKWSDSDFWPHNTTMFVKDFKGNSPRWLFHLFEYTDLSGFDSGSVQPMLNRNYISAVPVLRPPLPEQQAIAEVLGALDDKIAANTRLAATADNFLSSYLDSFICPTTPNVRLSEIAAVNEVSIKSRSQGRLRYVDIASVSVGSFDYPELSLWSEAPGRARRQLRRGDTIWSTVRPNRRSHALNLSDDPQLIASTGLAVLTPKTVDPSYLYEVTRRPEFTSYLENVAEGSAYPAVRAGRFAEAAVPMLTDDARATFEAIAAPLRENVHALTTENRTLAATRDALLPKLMSGQLRVKNAEKILSEVGV